MTLRRHPRHGGPPRSKSVTWHDPRITASGRVVKPGRRIALATAEIADAAGKVPAAAT